jgi:plastocyanin
MFRSKQSASSNARLVCGVALLLLGWVWPVEKVGAATNLVRMLSTDQFSPRLLTNHVGDTVLWTNASSSSLFTHNAVSSNGAWTAVAPFPPPGTFSVKFTNAGVYGYYCQNHLVNGMTGIIYVAGPPVVSLTNPVSGTTLAAPATITLRAAAAASFGSVTNVQFFSDASPLGSAPASPYNLIVSDLSAGLYNFTARAFDNLGGGATSVVVSVSVVTPGPVAFDTNSLNADASFPLRLAVTTGLSYEITYSTTLTNWLFFTNFTATNAVMSFSSPKIGLDERFFRARLLPNP